MSKFYNTLVSFFFVVLLNLSLSFSQTDTTSQIVQIDTNIYKPITNIGGLPDFLLYHKISKNHFVESDIVSVYELIERKTPYEFLTFGSLGNSPILNEYGLIHFPVAKQNLNTLLLLPTHFTSFELTPLLFYSSIEVVSGSASHILDKNSNGILFNFKTRQFNTKVPYTQIWIGQAGYDYLGSSAVFSQNIAKNVNFFFLYQRYWSAGRYDNSNSDRWNIVGGIRWFAHPRLNFYLENRYTNLNNGLFGGLNPDKSTILFDNNFSVVNFENLNRKIKQNDLSFNYIYILSSDSSIFFDGGLLFTLSSQEFEFEDYYAEFFNISSKSKYKSNGIFVNTRFVVNKDSYQVYLGGEIEKRNQNSWLFYRENRNLEPSVFFIFNKPLGKEFDFQIGSRISKEFKNLSYAFGSKFTYKYDQNGKTYIDISICEKSDYGNFKHSILGIWGLSKKTSKFEVLAEIYARGLFDYMVNSLVYDTLGNILMAARIGSQNYSVFGSNLRLAFPVLQNFNWHTNANVTYILSGDGNVKEWLPTIVLTNEISYRFTRGASYLDIGIEFTLLSPFRGLYFHPLYPNPVEYDFRRDWQTNGISAFARAKLGNAFVNVSLNNILSVNYYFLPIYPEYDRNIRVTVFWSFND